MKYNIITGLRRSGTSMLMYALKQGGVEVIGKDFDEKTRQHIEGNPNGYWEVDGITTKGLINFNKKGELIKVMVEGLYNSDPSLIDKTLFIFREPSKVFNSIFSNNMIQYPDLFIINNALDVVDSLDFLVKYNKEFKPVFYDKVIENPEKEMQLICDFIGGDYKKASEVIDNKLDRSSDKLKQDGLEVMYVIYKLALKGHFGKIIEMRDDIENKGRKLLEKYKLL